MKAGAGHPMGPLTLSDFVGLDTLGSICDVMFDEFRERRFAQPPTLRKMLAAGWYGRSRAWASTTTPATSRSRTRASEADVTERPRRRSSARPRRRARAPPREGGASRASCRSASASARLLDEGSFVEDALLANWEQDGLGADGVVTGIGDGRRPPGRGDGQRPDRQGRLVGPEDGREDHPHPGAGARAPRCRWSTSSTRPARASPSRSQMFPGRRGAGRIFHNEVKMSRRRAAGLRAVRAERRRRRLHPGLLRRRDHARRQRLDVPRLAADGRDGDRREGHARGDGRRADAHRRLAAAATSSSRPTRRASTLARRYLSYFPTQLGGASRRSRRRPSRRRDARDPRHRPGRREQAVRHARADRRARRRGLVPRGPRALGQGADRRLRAPRRPRRRDRRQPAASRRAACCSSTPPTRRRASSGPATPSTCRCCSWPTCPAS